MFRFRPGFLTAPALGLAAILAASATPAMAQNTNGAAMSPVQQMTQQHLMQLHQQLGITQSEEGAWNQFAQASMQNATQLDTQFRSRAGELGSMNAVQNMQSYAQIESQRAQDMRNLVPQFQNLYASLSPQQQQQADSMFRNMAEAHAQKHGRG